MNYVKSVLLMGIFSIFVPLGAMEKDVFLSDFQAKQLYNFVVGMYDECLSLHQSIINYNKAPSNFGLKKMNDRLKFFQQRIEKIVDLGVHDFDIAYYESSRGPLSEATLFSVAFTEYSILSKLYSSKFRSILPDSLVYYLKEMKKRIHALQEGLGSLKAGFDL